MNRKRLSTHSRTGFTIAVVIGMAMALAVLSFIEAERGGMAPLEGWQRAIFYGLPLSLWLGVLFWARTIDLALRKLRQTERFSTSVIAVSTDAIIVIDQRGLITLFSPAAERLFGYASAEAIGRNIKFLMPEPDSGAHDGYLRRYLETGQRQIIGQGRIVAALDKTGREFPVRLSIGEMQLDDQRFFVGIVSDFSERLSAERKIIQFGKAAEANPDMIYITDARGRIEFVNPAFTRLTGWTPEEVMGRTPNFLDSPRTAPAMRSSLRETLDRGEPWRGRLLIATKDGGDEQPALWLDMTMAPIRDDAGAITGHVSLGRDVTEKVRLKQQEAVHRESMELRVRIGEVLQSQQSLREKLSGALELLLSMEGLVLQNKGGLFLLKPDEQPPRLHLYLTRGEFSAEFLEKEQCIAMGACLCGRAAVGGELLVSNDCFCDPRHEHRFENMQPHGHYIVPLSDSANTLGVLFLYTDPHPNPDPARLEMLRLVGQMMGLAIANDQLQQRICAARDAAMEATRVKSQFLANMSHEIRTPMNGLLGMLELLRDTPLAEKQLELVETGYNAALSLLDILNDILDYSRMEAGKLDLDHGDFDLRNLIDDLGALFSSRANKQGLELLCYTAPDLPRLFKGDPIRLRQVLTNLLSNAIKFTPSGEVALTVTGCRRADGRFNLDFEVRDSGIGIAPEVQGKLFQSFVQADGSSTRGYGGTGLGLAISRQLVELMGGSITIESQLGSGSTFRFSLALEAGDAQQLPPCDQPSFHGMRVLVVDDNATNRRILEHYLASAAIPCSSAASGMDALIALRQGVTTRQPYTVVILDMSMPGMDGLELARRIKADSELAGLQLLMLSSIGLDRADAYQAGVFRSLVKPVRRQILMDVLAGLAGPTPPAPASRPVISLPGFHGHVLLVEDNVANQMVAKGLLTRYGLTTDVANDGLEALARIGANHYDLVVMDCQMPVMDGYTATRELRRREQAEQRQRLPVIAMTANAMAGDRERCLEADMDDYVAKPLTRDSLVALLGKWLRASPDLRPTVESPAPRVIEPPVAPPPSASLDNAIDHDSITSLREVMGGAFGELVNTYLNNSPALLEECRRGIETGNTQMQYQSTHTLKSSSALLGAKTLSRLAAELETMARLEQLATPAQAEQLDQEFDRVRESLTHLIR